MASKLAENSPAIKKKHGGRKKGSLNRNTQAVSEMCEAMGFNPIETLIYFANGDWKSLDYASETVIKPGFAGIEIEEYTISQELRYKANADLARFIHPHRKSVEHKVDSDTSKAITFNYIEPKNDKP